MIPGAVSPALAAQLEGVVAELTSVNENLRSFLHEELGVAHASGSFEENHPHREQVRDDIAKLRTTAAPASSATHAGGE